MCACVCSHACVCACVCVVSVRVVCVRLCMCGEFARCVCACVREGMCGEKTRTDWFTQDALQPLCKSVGAASSVDTAFVDLCTETKRDSSSVTQRRRLRRDLALVSEVLCAGIRAEDVRVHPL